MSDELSRRLWSRVDRSQEGCWEWQAGKTAAGYGEFMFQRKMYYAHRAAWILSCGDIPDGKCVRHKCDNPACCRPDHLELGTQNDNVQDMMSRGRGRKAVGNQNARSKLNPTKVRQVRRMRRQGKTLKQIAEAMGVNDKTIHAIVTGKTWKHVKDFRTGRTSSLANEPCPD